MCIRHQKRIDVSLDTHVKRSVCPMRFVVVSYRSISWIEFVPDPEKLPFARSIPLVMSRRTQVFEDVPSINCARRLIMCLLNAQLAVGACFVPSHVSLLPGKPGAVVSAYTLVVCVWLSASFVTVIVKISPPVKFQLFSTFSA